MKIIIIIMILFTATVCFGFSVGKTTGFNSGIIVGGKTGFIVQSTESGGDTYWNTAMTDRWSTAMTALWNTPMNTEIP